MAVEKGRNAKQGARSELQVEGERGRKRRGGDGNRNKGKQGEGWLRAGRTLISVHRRCFFWGETSVPQEARGKRGTCIKRNEKKVKRRRKVKERGKRRKRGEMESAYGKAR